ncbi:hypothetical protein ACTHGU_22145 [Chitinophagaceae bacterium MMS25-I14]
MKRIKYLMLCASLLMAGKRTTAAKMERIGLKSAMEQGMVTLQARAAKNGYHEIKLQLKNTTTHAMQVVLDPALTFRPADTSYQDLVIAGDRTLVLTGRQTQELTVPSFCAKSYAASPASDISYTFWRQGDSSMLHLMEFVAKEHLYDDLGQNAVWVLTNHHELNGVFDASRPAVSMKLVQLMASLTGLPLPEYFKGYKLQDIPGRPAFVPKVLKMYAIFEWKLDVPKVLTAGIYNEEGKMIQPVMEQYEFPKGGNRITVTFEAEHVKAGNYYIRLTDGALVLKETKVTVD